MIFRQFQPTGYTAWLGQQKGTILKLGKSLYGIRQVPRVFYQLVREHLIIHGLLAFLRK
jgi:hypothetical protein